jgi:hypothetical protein
VEPAFDGANRNVERCRYLGLGQAAHVEKHDRRRLSGRQPGDGEAHTGRQLCRLSVLQRIRSGIDWLVQRATTPEIGGNPGCAAAVAQPAPSDIKPDSCQPGAKLRRIVEVGKANQCLERRLLRCILGPLAIAKGADA